MRSGGGLATGDGLVTGGGSTRRSIARREPPAIDRQMGYSVMVQTGGIGTRRAPPSLAW